MRALLLFLLVSSWHIQCAFWAVSLGGPPIFLGGVALLTAVGLYPPGSFVELVSGEIGIVVARGPQANWTVVAVLIGADGSPRGNVSLRYSNDRRYAVKAAVNASTVQVRPPHEALMLRR